MKYRIRLSDSKSLFFFKLVLLLFSYFFDKIYLLILDQSKQVQIKH